MLKLKYSRQIAGIAAKETRVPYNRDRNRDRYKLRKTAQKARLKTFSDELTKIAKIHPAEVSY